MDKLKKKFDRYPHKDYEKEWGIVLDAYLRGYCTRSREDMDMRFKQIDKPVRVDGVFKHVINPNTEEE